MGGERKLCDIYKLYQKGNKNQPLLSEALQKKQEKKPKRYPKLFEKTVADFLLKIMYKKNSGQQNSSTNNSKKKSRYCASDREFTIICHFLFLVLNFHLI